MSDRHRGKRKYKAGNEKRLIAKTKKIKKDKVVAETPSIKNWILTKTTNSDEIQAEVSSETSSESCEEESVDLHVSEDFSFENINETEVEKTTVINSLSSTSVDQLDIPCTQNLENLQNNSNELNYSMSVEDTDQTSKAIYNEKVRKLCFILVSPTCFMQKFAYYLVVIFQI